MNDKLKRKEKGKKNMNNSAEHKHHNRTEVRAVKREIVYSLQNLNKSILGLFGLIIAYSIFSGRKIFEGLDNSEKIIIL